MRERILQLKHIASTVAICAMLVAATPTHGMVDQARLEKGRSLFYQAVQEEAKLDSAMALYQDLAESSDSLHGRALVYMGALTSLKGKHAFLPQKKVKFVNTGIEIMEEGITVSPTDVEALFVYGSTLYYLPFFFGKKEDAQKTFDLILEYLPGQIHAYDNEMIQNVLAFLDENADLSESQTALLESLQMKVASQ
jgi:hypothetical protein